VVRTPELERAADENPRPVILQRLADLAGALHNTPLKKQLDAMARRISTRESTPSRTGNRSLIECERGTDQLKAGNVRARRQWIPSHGSALSMSPGDLFALEGRAS